MPLSFRFKLSANFNIVFVSNKPHFLCPKYAMIQFYLGFERFSKSAVFFAFEHLKINLAHLKKMEHGCVHTKFITTELGHILKLRHSHFIIW